MENISNPQAITSDSLNKNVSRNTATAFFKLSHKLLALFVIAWMSNGLFTYIMPYLPNIIRWGSFFIWLGIAFIANKHFISKFIMRCSWLVIFLGYLFLLSFFVSDAYIFIYIQSFMYLLIIFSLFLYYFEDKYTTFRKVIFFYLLLESIYLAVNTYMKLNENPLLSRLLATGTEMTKDIFGHANFQGIGSYGYFYGLVAVIILSLYLSINFPKRKLTTLVLFVGFSLVLIKSSFTIAILFTVLLSFVLLMINLAKKNLFIPIFITVIAIILVSQGAIVGILNYFSDFEFLSAEIRVRLNELATFFSYNSISTGTDLHARSSLYTESLESFFNNLLLGTSLSLGGIDLAGGHSAWLDLLSRLGLSSFPLFCFFFIAFKYTLKKTPAKFKTITLICWIYFCILGFVNTMFFSSIFTVWLLFIPIAIKVIDENNFVTRKRLS